MKLIIKAICFVLCLSLFISGTLSLGYSLGSLLGKDHTECVVQIPLSYEGSYESSYFMLKIADKKTCELMDFYSSKNWLENCHLDYIDDEGNSQYECPSSCKEDRDIVCKLRGYEGYNPGFSWNSCYVSNCGGTSSTNYDLAKYENMNRSNLACGGAAE